MSPTFEQPELLWLLLLAVPIALLGHFTLKALDPVRRYTAIGLRLAVLLLLVLVLAGLRAEQRNTDLTVIALVDQSASVDQLADLPTLEGVPTSVGMNPIATTPVDWARQFLALAGQDQRPTDRFGWLTFDQRPTIQRSPRRGLDLDQPIADRPRDGTDIARVIEQAIAAKAQADAALRLVLVTDGNDTTGNLDAAVDAAAAAGIPIDVLPLPYKNSPEVMVEGVYTPKEARLGQTVPVRIVLRATRPTPGRLFLRHDGRFVDLDPAADQQLGAPISPTDWSIAADADSTGGQELGRYILVRSIDRPLLKAFDNQFEALFEPTTTTAQDDNGTPSRYDAVAVNNAATAFTYVQGRGKILIVDNVGGAPGTILRDALRSKGLAAVNARPDQIPRTLRDLREFDAVFFQNVPRSDVPEPLQRDLVRYVHDLGGGFVMLGGPDSFGAGAWTNSEIDKRILAVTCQVPNQSILPSGALILCIDRSGSMMAPVGNTTKTQIDIAAEAAELALSTLYPQDLVGVIAFDSNPKWIVPLSPNTDPAGTAQKIRALEPGGGTDVIAGLEEAYQTLSAQEFQQAAVRHCIVLTDGQTGEAGLEDIRQRFQRADISVTSVGIGDGQNTDFLQRVPVGEGGKFEPITDPTQLPRIFIKQAQLIRRNLIKTQTFVPQMVNSSSPITTQLPQPPPLDGLVVTGPRDDGLTFTPMLGPEGEPLFAHRQVGLGRSAAFTSTAHAQWDARWVSSDIYADFWKRTADFVARPEASREADLTTTLVDNRLRIKLDAAATSDPSATDASARFANQLTIEGTVTTPSGNTVPITLTQSGPGLYEADLPAPDAGNYIVYLQTRSPDGQVASVFGGASAPPGKELRRFTPNTARLERIAQQTGGRVLSPNNPQAAGLFARDTEFISISSQPLRWTLLPLLLLALLLDVANRRIAWQPAELWAGTKSLASSVAGARTKRHTTTEESARSRTALAAAKARATTDNADNAPPPTKTDASRKFTPEPQSTKPRQPVLQTAAKTKTDAPTKPKPANDPAPEPTGPTTSRLLAARKRAQDRLDR
ncbi:MAG: VWA domain-containing protein [Planctomycetota bacterium]